MFKPIALSRRWAALISGDFLVAYACAQIVFRIFQGRVDSLSTARAFSVLALELAALYLMAMYMLDGYAITSPLSRSRMVGAVVSATGSLSVLLALSSVAFPSLLFGRRVFVTYVILVTMSETGWRLLALGLMSNWTRFDVIVAGQGERAKSLVAELARHKHLGYRFQGYLLRNGHFSLVTENGRVLSEPLTESALSDDFRRNGLKNVVIDQGDAENIPIHELIRWRMDGVQVVSYDDFFERLTGKLNVPFLDEKWLVVSPGFVRSPWRLKVKRLFDLGCAIAIGILTLPVSLAAAIAIKIDSAGPVLYRQDRVGLAGKVFRLSKFRSMRENAENDGGAIWAQKNDPRVTRVGWILRRFRIDELPQLINVITGDMSMIGPRPERPEFVSQLIKAIPAFEYRQTMKPGLTGWAQVCHPYTATISDAGDKLGYDLYYLKNWSLTFDVQIAMQTTKVVLFGRGAR